MNDPQLRVRKYRRLVRSKTEEIHRPRTVARTGRCLNNQRLLGSLGDIQPWSMRRRATRFEMHVNGVSGVVRVATDQSCAIRRARLS